MHTFIFHLAAAFGLDGARAARLWQLSGLDRPPAQLGPVLQRGLAALAALLLGAGLVFWVAANWQEQSRMFRLQVLEAAVLLPVLGALVWRAGRTALLLLATLALGALLAFVGQTYQTGADAWQLFAAWALLALPWALVARRDALWALWLLVAGTGLAMWAGHGLLDPLGASLLWAGGPRGLLAPLLWALVFALPLALPRLGLVPQARAVISGRLGALLALSAWNAHGLWGLLMHEVPGQYTVSLLLVAAALALAWWRRPRDYVVLALAVLAANVLVLAGMGWLLFAQDHRADIIGTLVLFTLLAAAALGASGAWLYRLQRQEEGA
ncbi:DUF2157 domain-containing protein [Pulveribacter suum]|uniref:DUF2157 domain-containing protein n=1 Tax=Pulveribacter suum TaxID=2116657 RepID=UPI0014756D0C|nr:DUF2157 domain-containing protein [Pulveribacter suum]